MKAQGCLTGLSILVFLIAGCINQDTEPTIQITGVEKWLNTNQGNITFRVIDDQTLNLNCQIKNNNIAVGSQFTCLNNTLIYIPMTLNQGLNLISVTAKDSSNNTDTATITIHVDSNAPVITYIDFLGAQ
jgi:hypothetical protein